MICSSWFEIPRIPDRLKNGVKVINRRSYDYYWIGLNNIENKNIYEWISTQGFGEISVDWTFWSDGLDPIGHLEPSPNPDFRCTYALFSDHLPGDYGTQGKWVKGKCEQKFKYVCKLDQNNFVRECDDGFTKIEGDEEYCYRYFKGAENRNGGLFSPMLSGL